jgi:hypothetical protein
MFKIKLTLGLIILYIYRWSLKYGGVDYSKQRGLITFSPKKSCSKHINMGASFEDLVETDLLVKANLNLELSFES